MANLQTENTKLQTEIAKLRPAKSQSGLDHVLCFVALPYRDEYECVLSGLRSVLEDAPYFWEVKRADERYLERTVSENAGTWISNSHCYVVDITQVNANVMMELGQMYWGFPERPLLLLQREGVKNDITDLSRIPKDRKRTTISAAPFIAASAARS